MRIVLHVGENGKANPRRGRCVNLRLGVLPARYGSGKDDEQVDPMQWCEHECLYFGWLVLAGVVPQKISKWLAAATEEKPLAT